MALPSAVKKQAARADRLIAEQAKGNTEATVSPEAPKAQEVSDQSATPAIKPEASAPGTPETAPASEEASQVLTEPLGGEKDNWKDRYKILQGKYNAEVPRLHAQVKTLTQQAQNAGDSTEVDSLRTKVAELEGQLASAPTELPNAPGLDALRENYPAELVDGILGVVKSMVDPVAKKIDSVDQSVSTSNTNSRIAQLRAILKTQSLDYDQINTDPLFIEDYLQATDDMSGEKRHVLMMRAFNNGNLDRAAKFFSAYVNEHTPNASQQSAADNSQANLQQHVKVETGAPEHSLETQKVPWSQPEIKQFYRDRQDGKLSDADFNRLEIELFDSMGGAN
jgi:hypothetical protein